MNTNTGPDLLSQIKPGDTIMYQDSTNGLYEVISLDHPLHGNGYLELRHVNLGHRDIRGGTFEYDKVHFKKEFTRIYATPGQKDLARAVALLFFANVSGEISEIHELLLKGEI